MSIPRRRGKVKKKSPAAPKKKKSVQKRPKGKVSPSTKPKKAKKKKLVVRKPPRAKVQTPKKKRSKKRKITPEQLDKLIQRTIDKADREATRAAERARAKAERIKAKAIAQIAKDADVSQLEVRVRMAGGTEEDLEKAAFLAREDVSRQITERIVEKGLFELIRGMSRTVESIMIGELLVAEQWGNFDQRARELAAEYNWPIQDIYELWHSPKNFIDA